MIEDLKKVANLRSWNHKIDYGHIIFNLIHGTIHIESTVCVCVCVLTYVDIQSTLHEPLNFS